MTTKNLLLLEEQKASTSSSLWEPLVLGNSSVKRSVVHFQSEPASLLVTSLNDNEMGIKLIRDIPVSSATRYRAFCSGYSDTSGHVFGIRVVIYNNVGTVIQTQESESAAMSGQWSLASVDFTTPHDARYASIRLFADPFTISPETGNKSYHREIWFDDIVMAVWADNPINDFLRMVEYGIPEYMLDIDEEDDVRPLRRYIDVMTNVADDVLTAIKAFDYIPAVDGVPGYDRCSLVDPSYYPNELIAKQEWLPWLAQLVGVQGVSSGSSGQTPWFWIEDQYETWLAAQTEIDPQSNAVWSVDSFARSGGVVTAILGTQTGGSTPYFPAVGDVVEVTHTGNFAGAFSVLSSVPSPTPTVTWNQTGINETSSVDGSLLISDTSWNEVEADNPLAFNTTAVLANLTRTRATGLHAGTKASIKAATRSVLDGFDSKGTVSWYQPNKVIITTEEPHTFVSGEKIEVYASSKAEWNIPLTVSTVINSRTVTASVLSPWDEGYGVLPCWVTDKIVKVVMTDAWNMKVQTLESQTYAVALISKVVDMAKPAGVVATHEYTT